MLTNFFRLIVAHFFDFHDLGVTFGSFRGHFGVTFGGPGGRLGRPRGPGFSITPVFTTVWEGFWSRPWAPAGATWGSLLSRLRSIWGHFWVSFGGDF